MRKLNKNLAGVKDIPLFIVAGWSGSGKTTFIEKLIPEFRNRGLRVGTVKHHHGDFEMDLPGKDSWRHKNAGAEATIISSPEKICMVRTLDHDPIIAELVPYLSDMDIIIVEGYKKAKRPKIEVFRSTVHESPRFTDDPDLIAVVSDIKIDSPVPVFALNDPSGLIKFIIEYFNPAVFRPFPAP